MNEAPTQQTPARRSAEDYACWVHTRLPGRFAESTLILDAPSADAVARLDSARRAGDRCVVCGFLVDEVEWPSGAEVGLVAWMAASAEFVPWLLEDSTRTRESNTNRLLYVHDRGPNQTASDPFAELARQCACLLGQELTALDVDEVSDTELAGAIASSSIVFNDVSQWACGFAIDEYAARMGREVVRIRHPGYSPLRQALLGQMVISARPLETPRIKPLIAAVLRRRERTVSAAASVAFSPLTSAAWWRGVMQHGLFALYLSGGSWASAAETAVRERSRWLNRPAGWAMLAAAGRSAAVPQETWNAVVEAVTSWLVEEQRSRTRGAVRDRAMARWVRFFPEWLDLYRSIVGDTRDSRSVVRFWVCSALEWTACVEPVAPMIERASWAFEDDGNDNGPWRLARFWRTNWLQVAIVVPNGGPIARPWMPACVESACLRLEELAAGDRSVCPALLAVLGRDELWRHSMGHVGTIMRLWGALRLGLRGHAVAIWRDWLCREGMSTRGGLAAVLRAPFPDAAAFAHWLRAAAAHPRMVGLEAAWLWRWHGLRADDLWRLNLAPVTRRELSAALRWLDQRRARAGVPVDALLHGALCALEGRAGDAVELVDEMKAKGHRLGTMPAVIALALWCRGAVVAARALLEAQAPPPGEGPLPLFLRAVAWQLLGACDRAVETLDRLKTIAPGFLAEGRPGDTRWAWAAVVFKHLGRIELANQMRRRAIAAGQDFPQLFGDVVAMNCEMAVGWEDLLSSAILAPETG